MRAASGQVRMCLYQCWELGACFCLRSVTCAYRGVYSRVGRRFCWYHFMRVRSVVHERDVEERVYIFCYALCWFLFKERKLVCFTRI